MFFIHFHPTYSNLSTFNSLINIYRFWHLLSLLSIFINVIHNQTMNYWMFLDAILKFGWPNKFQPFQTQTNRQIWRNIFSLYKRELNHWWAPLTLRGKMVRAVKWKNNRRRDHFAQRQHHTSVHISTYLHISPHISTYLHIYLHLTNKFGLYLHISSIPHPAITQHHHHNQDKLANPNQLRRNALFQNISQTCFKDVFRILLLEHSGSNNVDLWCYDIVLFFFGTVLDWLE